MCTNICRAPSFLSLVGFFHSFSVPSPSRVSAFDLHPQGSGAWPLNPCKESQGSVAVSPALGKCLWSSGAAGWFPRCPTARGVDRGFFTASLLPWDYVDTPGNEVH